MRRPSVSHAEAFLPAVALALIFAVLAWFWDDLNEPMARYVSIALFVFTAFFALREWYTSRVQEELLGELQSAQRGLKSKIDQRTHQLQEVNRNLESFCYSVSHDLRAPLRSIDGFSHALQEDYETDMDETAKDYLSRIRNNAQRMGNLIDDLLQLSRIDRARLKIEAVDLGGITRKVVDSLRERDPDRDVAVNVQENLVVRGDSRLLRIAMENILENAWKFTSHTKNPKIDIKMQDEADACVISIKDNGAGFDDAYVDKIFQPFQRLCNEYEFDGTGIGLATVERIVTAHGGRIWARAAAGQGATFFIRLPA
jgi:signal transduction histidine kinase